MAKSLWDLASEIYTDYEGTITDATFRFNEFGGQMSFTVDEIDGRSDPVFENYNLPPGWESNDGGDTIARVDGSDKGIVKTSQWGKFLGAAASCQGVDSQGKQVRDSLGEDAPVTASVWIGTRWHFDAVEGKKFKEFTKDGVVVPAGQAKDKNYPDKFLGRDNKLADVSSSNGSGNGKIAGLSVLTDLHNPVLEQNIVELAKTTTQAEWFNQSYKMLTEAGVKASDVPDLITAMGGNELYVKLGGKG